MSQHGEGGAACWTCGGPHAQDDCPHRVRLRRRTSSQDGDAVDLLLPVEDEVKETEVYYDDQTSTAGDGGERPTIPEVGDMDTAEWRALGEGQTVEGPVTQRQDGPTEGAKGHAPTTHFIMDPCSPDVRPHQLENAEGMGSHDALSSLGGSESSSPSFPHGLDHPPLNSIPPPPEEDGRKDDGRRSPPPLLSRRSVSWANEACVVEETEHGHPNIHRLPLEQTVSADSPRNRTPPPLSLTRPRNEFALDTGRLSLLTLRYVVAQAWALTQVRLSLTLMLTGVLLDCIRFWHLSLPLVILLASAIYLSQYHQVQRNRRRPSTKASTLSEGAEDEEEVWVRWALDLCSSERWRERMYDWFKQIFKDKNRVRVILLCLQVLPVNIQVYAMVVLTLEIHQYPTLALMAFLYLTIWLVASKTVLLPHNSFGMRTRVTKFGLYTISLAYLAITGEWICLLRLLGPTLITVGGVLFTTLPPDEVGMATRSAVTLMLRDVMLLAKERLVTEHELIQIALNRWMLEYWDNPSDFTWEDFLPMMQYIFKTMRGEVPESTLPTLHALARRMNHLHTDPLGAALVHRIRSDVSRIAPPKRFSVLLILSRASRHLLVLFFDLIVMACFMPQYRSATFPLALLPLLVLDVTSIDKRGPKLLKLLSPNGTESEALCMLLSGAEGLLTVWNNLSQALVACETGLKVPMVKVLDHSDKAELFTHTMKAYQGMAKARAVAHREKSKQQPSQTPQPAQEWNFKSGWAMVELQRLRYCEMYEGANDDARGLYSRAMRSYIKWLVDAPGHFNNWLHSVMFTVTSAALPLTARGSIDLGDLSAASSVRDETHDGGRPSAAASTPQAGDLLSLSPWVKHRDTRFFVPTCDPLHRSLQVAIETLPTPTSSRSAFWWTQAGGASVSFLPSSSDTEGEEDEVSSGSNDHGHHNQGHLRQSGLGSPEGGASRNDRIEVMRVKNLFCGTPESVEVVEEEDGRVFLNAALREEMTTDDGRT